MSKDKLFHRTPKDSKSIMGHIQAGLDRRRNEFKQEAQEVHELTDIQVDSMYTRPIDGIPLDQEIVLWCPDIRNA